jgi:hypothetical protein
VAIIDFPPRSIWFEPDHGVSPDTVRAAFEGTACRLTQHDPEWGGATFLMLFECHEKAEPDPVE